MPKIVVFCGHGGLSPRDADTELKVPEGSTFNVYLKQFKSLMNVIGQVIESGEKTPLKPSETVLAGHPLPNFRLFLPKGLAIAPPANADVLQIKTDVVGGETLRTLIDKNPEQYKNVELRWAACRVDMD
jgi:hypothetical protein